MTLPSSISVPEVSLAPPVPAEATPLDNGDRLTRDEFERRYEAMPQVKKAELIEGEVYMPSPVRFNQHAVPHSSLIGWFFTYRAFTPCVRIADNATIRLDLENEVQPDLTMLIEPAFGGRAAISQDDYIEGSPELVAEIAASSVSIDLNKKFRVYQRNGVREYIVWRVQEQAIDWFILQQGQFQRLQPDADGIHRSLTFPGLWLDAASMLRSDLAAVLQKLHEGIQSQEHAEFVSQLQAKATSN
jgi:Uma2 family endonuclease